MAENRTHKIGRRDVLKATGAAVAIGGLAGCVGDDDDDSPYEIGMVDSRTGSLEPFGERNERGKQLALDHINSVGIGDNDRELEVIVEDSESLPEPGVDAARNLVDQEGVPILIGGVGSGVTMGIHESVIEGTDTVQISHNSTGAVLSEHPDLLRISPSGAEKGRHLAEIVADDGYDEVALTYVNNDYGVSLRDVFEENFDGDVLATVAHEEEEPSLSGEVSEMEETGAEAWIFITYAEEFTVFVNEIYDRDLHEQIQFYGAESTIADTILENTPEGSHDGMVGVSETAPTEEAAYQNYESQFNDEYGTDPSVWSAYAYDSVMVSAIAIHVADEFEGESIAEVVREVTQGPGEVVNNLEEAKEVVEDGGDPDNVNYEGVSGPIELDENGDPTGAYQLYHVEGHEYEWGDFLI